MKTFYGLAMAGAATALNTESLFMDFVATYGKMMGTMEEFNFRKEIFAATHEFIEAHNAGDHSF